MPGRRRGGTADTGCSTGGCPRRRSRSPTGRRGSGRPRGRTAADRRGRAGAPPLRVAAASRPGRRRPSRRRGRASRGRSRRRAAPRPRRPVVEPGRERELGCQPVVGHEDLAAGLASQPTGEGGVHGRARADVAAAVQVDDRAGRSWRRGAVPEPSTPPTSVVLWVTLDATNGGNRRGRGRRARPSTERNSSIGRPWSSP